ncbi:winged helix-turn-helix transcriptional regulator [Aurantiacibacter sp. MUD11]|uniref:winged helix-turn-helix transcriptional regulator n=1 Tax=Aurantiacibacter sp. MUD11 TaxID=3003265 RepID=UPI0022AA2155|nr:winged helix-turn-helix transcriptional regulator [Aurantiacibacter sp. MUD11]WAT18026.1 winged helix-turn-helix transcriptional regulator [Aurantiacibacter sp. MUD11]
MNYGQFCPIAKANEILGEKWTFLIVRELVMGGRRFNELQRGLGDISPALLTKRLKTLEEDGLVARRRIPGQRGHEYWPTQACTELTPVLVELGKWGLQWARHNVLDSDLDPELLMLYLERSIDPGKLVGDRSVIRFQFKDLDKQKEYWLLVQAQNVDLCITDPGRDVDVYFCSTLRVMHDCWMGDRTFRDAIRTGDLLAEGEPALLRNVTEWLRPSIFAEAPRAPMPSAA